MIILNYFDYSLNNKIKIEILIISVSREHKSLQQN